MESVQIYCISFLILIMDLMKSQSSPDVLRDVYLKLTEQKVL